MIAGVQWAQAAAPAAVTLDVGRISSWAGERGGVRCRDKGGRTPSRAASVCARTRPNGC